MTDKIVPNSVGWYILEGFPWWPVYICDVQKLRPKLHILGSGHEKILKKARDFPSDFTVVYYFGSHDFSIVGLKKGVLRPWECAEKDQFLKGHPKHLIKKKGILEDLVGAIHEAEEYLSQPEDIRVPQYMVPSDLDPTLEPPPALLLSQEETDEEVASRHDIEPITCFDEPQEEEEDQEEGGFRRKSKKKDDKKQRRLREKKKKKKKKDEDEESTTMDGCSGKVLKTSLESDVKSASQTGTKTSMDKVLSPSDMSMETLCILLEKEIRWILFNCVFEEMTTKTVRKMLEKRLGMDLRHHKASIKKGVARVIASMEEEEDAGESIISTVPDESDEQVQQLHLNTDVNEMKASTICDTIVDKVDVPMKDKVDVAMKEEAACVDEYAASMKQELEAASRNLLLALELEPKIMDALSSLKTLDNVDKHVLATSTLQSRLVKLRAHPSSRICELVAFLVKKWDVEELIPAPKPITKNEILALKAKLENPETIHDELLVTLNQLGEMALTIDHLKKTRIARTVSKLRQHGNDKVSAKAHELRQKWIKQSSEQSTDSDLDLNPLKTLKTLNRILEQQSDGTDEQKLQSKQLAALEQLHSMSLDTKDIIDSKVGIPVSKLRKSSNERIAELAKKLRMKWRAEAKG
ncbi:unnamed protein product [Peronospora belbahrii]|uniref:TFIIS N-terminal domain-containing protein n=1 Tax=Peronospora belbahrii TaxID=622444 RepID=A0AAU9LB79_9STRA|nr:unnamed protein product [Peronospora belbahrii]